MQVYIPAISVLKGLHDCRLEGGIFQEIMGTPHSGRFLSNQVISSPVHTDIGSHIVGTLVNAADHILPAVQAACNGNRIPYRDA